MSRKFTRYLGPITGLCLFVAALWVLHKELRSYHEILADLRQVGSNQVWLALLFTVLSYFVLTWYDSLAFRYIRRPMPYHKIAFGSFLGYVFSHNIGLSVVGASAARLRVYSSWGVTPLEIAKIVVFCSMTFWLGFGIMGSLVFLICPLEVPENLQRYLGGLKNAWPLGVFFLGLTAAYLSLVIFRHKPFQVRGWQIDLPNRSITLIQVLLSSLDWFLFGSVLYVLLPSGHNLPFLQYMGVFLLAEAAALASHVPGGIGVLDAVILFLLIPQLEPTLHEAARDRIMASLVAYRGIYYLLPLVMGTAMLGIHELLQRKKVPKPALAGQWGPVAVPNLLSVAAFIAGAALLLSGAMPESLRRLEELRGRVGYLSTEIAHLLGSLVGMSLLVLARGLQRRLRSAYVWSLILLGVGCVLCLTRGLDYIAAGILLVVLLALFPAARHFYRKASLATQWFTPIWVTTICSVLVLSIWIGIFGITSFRGGTGRRVASTAASSPANLASRWRAESWDEWWQHITFYSPPDPNALPGFRTPERRDLERRMNVGRFLRASAGAVALGLFITFWRLVRPGRHKRALPTADDLLKAKDVIAASTRSDANLALLEDKELLFLPGGRSMIMFRIEGRSWVAMGDVLGDDPQQRKDELTWQFRELSDRNGGWTVFYSVGPERLELYLELGLTTFKLGEEALVPLEGFSLQSPQREDLRKSCQALEEAGCSFEMVQPPHSQELLNGVGEISRQYLTHRHAREKSFSLGSFDPSYLQYGPLALVRQGGSIVGFSNVWLGGRRDELSLDMIRYLPGSPSDLIDCVFTRSMLWGRQQGYRWFNLGLAPLSGLEDDGLAPLWAKIADSVFRHGEHFYNFQALRQYKQRFDPQWQTRYVACPGGLALGNVLTNIAAVICRGIDGTSQE